MIQLPSIICMNQLNRLLWIIELEIMPMPWIQPRMGRISLGLLQMHSQMKSKPMQTTMELTSLGITLWMIVMASPSRLPMVSWRIMWGSMPIDLVLIQNMITQVLLTLHSYSRSQLHRQITIRLWMLPPICMEPHHTMQCLSNMQTLIFQLNVSTAWLYSPSPLGAGTTHLSLIMT